MRVTYHTVPGTGPALERGTAMLIAAAILAVPLLVPPLLVAVTWQDHRHPEFFAMLGFALGLCMSAIGWGCFGRSILDVWRTYRMHQAGAPLGLSPARAPTEDDLDELRDLPLFAFSKDANRATVWGMEGDHRGVRLRVFEFGFEGLTVDRHGARRRINEVQTLALVPDVGPPGRFHCGPAANAWNDLDPEWQYALGLTSSLEFSHGDAPVRPVVHSDDQRDTDVLFTPRRQEELTEFDGLVVECSGGSLLVYRHGRVVEPDELGRFLDSAAEVAEILGRRTDSRPDAARSERIQAARPPADAPSHPHGLRREQP